MRFAAILAGLCGALFLSGCAGGALTAGAGGRQREPAVWMIRDRDSTLYLYGTIHVMKPGSPWGGVIAERSLSAADEVWTEIEIGPQADLRIAELAIRHGVDPSRRLTSQLDAGSAERLRRESKLLGLDPAALETLRPWLAALTLSNLAVAAAGYEPTAGADRAIDSLAEAGGKRMRWLESAEQQIRFFSDLPLPLQLDMLKEAMDEADQAPATIGALYEAWKDGDLRRLSIILGDMESTPELYDVLIKGRNEAWAQQLAEELNGEGVDFVAVGAAHLVGRDSLIAQLRKRGYRAERVRSVRSVTAAEPRR